MTKTPDGRPVGPTRRARAVAGRTTGVVARLLRLPAAQDERHHDLAVRLDQLNARLIEAHQQIDDLRATEAARHAATSEAIAAVHSSVLRSEQIANLTELAANLQAGAALQSEALRRIDTSAAALLNRSGGLDEPSARNGDLVSIVLPVHDRPEELRHAVRSVLAQTYENWQLVIVDDRSAVDPATTLSDLLPDDRVQFTTAPEPGAAAARNHGVRLCQGEQITFLDSDNWWYPHRLASVMTNLDPQAAWAVDQQVVRGDAQLPGYVRSGDEHIADLSRHNSIDLGMIIVRRETLTQMPAGSDGGPFDQSFRRLSDWDFVTRLTAVSPPQFIASVGQVYETSRDDRISDHEPFGPPAYDIRYRSLRGSAAGLRVLFAEWHFPQVTETYIDADIAGLVALGAEVEVWSEEDVAVPYEPSVRWHRGRLEDAIERFQPDLVFTHWLNMGHKFGAAIRQLGLPHAVRAHGFDHDEGLIRELATDPTVAVHLFPHQIGSLARYPNVSGQPSAFDPGRIQPAVDQDRRMVLRLVAGLHTKELELFMLTAKRCPEHRFVLGIGRAYLAEHGAAELAEKARELDAPVDVRIDVPYDDAAQLTMDAGIYLHTHGTSHRLGMPMSPIEAMAAGSYVLARNLPGVEVLGAGAVLYDGDTVEERADLAAALINDTLTWDEDRWATQRRAALDQAWSTHPADLVMHNIVQVWRDRFDL